MPYIPTLRFADYAKCGCECLKGVRGGGKTISLEGGHGCRNKPQINPFYELC